MAKIPRLALAALVGFIANVGDATVVSDNFGTLTPGEWQSLQDRVQQQRTDVITTAAADQEQLLKSTSRPIAANAPHMEVLLGQMRKAMLAHEGTGLTAVQIGIPVRVVLMQRTINGSRLFHSFINPEIIRISPSKASYRERCLSLANGHGHMTERAVYLTLRYQKTDGHTAIETFTGLDAAVMQQEIDHLNGILLTDHHPH